MNRLTKNMDTQYDFIGSYDTNIEEFTNNKKLRISVMNKLGQLEDIEEELGIDLITLFKALENGIWVKNKEDNIIRHLCSKLGYQVCGSFSLGGIKFEDTYYNEYYYNYEDYGKTWALTKEELENDN